MMRAGVVGHPIGHSKSPLIHNYWLKKYGVAARYDAFDVPPDDLPAFVKSAAEKGLAGFNVTVPHKVAVMDLLDELSEAAKKAARSLLILLGLAWCIFVGTMIPKTGAMRLTYVILPHAFLALPLGYLSGTAYRTRRAKERFVRSEADKLSGRIAPAAVSRYARRAADAAAR